MTKQINSLPYLLAFILLSVLTNAFQIDSDYSYCNALIIRAQVSPQELNTTSGMVLQFTQSPNISDPALFNTTIAWTDFVPYTTYNVSRLLPATQIGNKYFNTNISMESAMNSSWRGSGTDQQYHTIMWLYSQPPNTTDPALRTSFGGFGNSFVPTSTVEPYCSSFYTVDGQRTDYNPNLIPYDDDNNSGGSGGGSSLSSGAKAGIAIGCLIGALLLLGFAALIGYIFFASVRGLLRSCLIPKSRRKRRDEEDQYVSPTIPTTNEYEEKQNKMSKKEENNKIQSSQPSSSSSNYAAMDIEMILNNSAGISRGEDQIIPTSFARREEEEAPPPSYTEANAAKVTKKEQE